MITLNWIRDPLYGGCRYFAGNIVVEGLYDPPLFESDCTAWTASNIPNQTFLTSDAAMAAAARQETEKQYQRARIISRKGKRR